MKIKSDKIKVLFLLNGLTHYFNNVLNRLNSFSDLEISTLVPSKDNESLGTGVYTTSKDVKFETYNLPVKKRYYGKLFFKGFFEVVNKVNPDIIVIIWPYVLELVFNPFLLKELRKRNVKIFYKDIPFQLVKFKDGLLMKHPMKWVEDRGLVNPTMSDRIKLPFLTLIRKLIYWIVDVNVDYTEDAVELLQSYGVKKDNIFVTYNSPDTDQLLRASEIASQSDSILPHRFNRLISVGRLVRWKKVDLLLKSIHILHTEINDIELVVVGTGPEEENLKSLAVKLGIDEYVKFVGPTYDPIELGRYYLSSSIYVQSGMGGLSLNDAMSFGKPIICSICDGTEKILVREGYNGMYFREGDEIDLASKIKILLSNESLIREYGKNSLSIIKKEVNINIVTERYKNAFMSILVSSL